MDEIDYEAVDPAIVEWPETAIALQAEVDRLRSEAERNRNLVRILAEWVSELDSLGAGAVTWIERALDHWEVTRLERALDQWESEDGEGATQ